MVRSSVELPPLKHASHLRVLPSSASASPSSPHLPPAVDQMHELVQLQYSCISARSPLHGDVHLHACVQGCSTRRSCEQVCYTPAQCNWVLALRERHSSWQQRVQLLAFSQKLSMHH